MSPGSAGATEDEVDRRARRRSPRPRPSATRRPRRSPPRWPREALPQAAEVPFSSARKWSAVAFAHADDRDCPGSSRSARRRSCGRRWPSASTASRRHGRSWSDATAAWTERGLRVLLVATFDDAAALPAHEDEAEATLPAGMRALGLVAMADELRGEAGADAALVRRGRRRRQGHLRRRPRDRRRAGAPGGPRRRRVDLGARARRPRRRRRSRQAAEADRLRPDHAGAEGAARRRAARRAATTWR